MTACTPWDQRVTLRPPQYQGPTKRLLGGLNIGDYRVDALPLSAVCCHGGQARKIGLDPHPEWVDWDSVRRGQKVFLKHIGLTYTALTFALLQGFSIARFAEVLAHNGYAQSGETAFERYRETSFAIVDWMSHPLDEENSKAQLQLQNVRAMHSFARRRSQKLFDPSKGEGIALSQYDMAEVQMSFAGITFNLLQTEFKLKISRDDLRDWCHTWRLIGYHLGIMDEFNACNSLEDMEAIVAEWMTYVPLRFKTCRPATFELQRTALEGFGRYTGMGVEIMSGLLHASCETRDWGTDLDYIERPCYPGLKVLGLAMFEVIAGSTSNKVMSYSVLHMRRTYEQTPERAKRMLPFLAAISRMNDMVLWPLVSVTVMQLTSRWKRIVIGCIIGALLTRSLHRLTLSVSKIMHRVMQ